MTSLPDFRAPRIQAIDVQAYMLQCMDDFWLLADLCQLNQRFLFFLSVASLTEHDKCYCRLRASSDSWQISFRNSFTRMKQVLFSRAMSKFYRRVSILEPRTPSVYRKLRRIYHLGVIFATNARGAARALCIIVKQRVYSCCNDMETFATYSECLAVNFLLVVICMAAPIYGPPRQPGYVTSVVLCPALYKNHAYEFRSVSYPHQAHYARGCSCPVSCFELFQWSLGS